MALHLQRDLDLLRKELLQLGGMVETSIEQALKALNERDTKLAESLLSTESEIDEKEVEIEENCLKILALHQPVAVDLRFIVVVLKVNNDLERMGDLAENIAERSLFLSSEPPIPCPPEFVDIMQTNIRLMVRNSLDALVNLDVTLANQVIAMDESVDIVNKQMYADLQADMQKDPDTIKRAVSILSTSRYMERIADLATNIAEDVVFMVDGDVVRHQE